MSADLITGATGFVGGALTLELLTRTDQDVVLMVRERAGAAETPRARVEAALGKAASCYGLDPELVDREHHRIRVVVGDLNGEIVQSPLDDENIARVWHCAASLQFDDKDKDEIYSTNVAGTEKALRLFRTLGAEEFHYISTAYVAGRRTGLIEETPATDVDFTHNHYERSKIEAERLLLGSDVASQIRIWRPSVVVGHGATAAATSFSGMYGFIKELVRFKMEVQRKLGAFLSMRPVQIMADPDMRLNIVPVDHVVRQAVSMAGRGVDGPIVHLTNATPPLLGKVISIIFDELDLAPPAFVRKKSVFTSLDQEFDDGMTFYGSYLFGDKDFQQDRAAEHGSAIAFEFDDATLVRFVRWYLNVLRVELESRGVDTAGLVPRRIESAV